ncbi:MAG: hypothetical protein RML94_02260 [Bacteroidia bacterium]|nr:hypothetical protein [Bacteroidia bacterium]
MLSLEWQRKFNVSYFWAYPCGHERTAKGTRPKIIKPCSLK